MKSEFENALEMSSAEFEEGYYPGVFVERVIESKQLTRQEQIKQEFEMEEYYQRRGYHHE